MGSSWRSPYTTSLSRRVWHVLRRERSALRGSSVLNKDHRSTRSSLTRSHENRKGGDFRTSPANLQVYVRGRSGRTRQRQHVRSGGSDLHHGYGEVYRGGTKPTSWHHLDQRLRQILGHDSVRRLQDVRAGP